MADIYLERIFTEKDTAGQIVITAWVYEDGEWNYRKLTDAEWKAYQEATNSKP